MHRFSLEANNIYYVYFSLAGFHSLCISGALLMLLLMFKAPLGHLFEMMLPLAVCAIGVSFMLSVYLYLSSFWAPSHALALGGNTGERTKVHRLIRKKASKFRCQCYCSFSHSVLKSSDVPSGTW